MNSTESNLVRAKINHNLNLVLI